MAERTAIALDPRSVSIPAGGVTLEGELVLPAAPRGLVIFARGSGSSRPSPRNRLVAEWLQRSGFGTLVLDLLSAPEERIDAITGALRFDIGLLAGRLGRATTWAASLPATRALPLGYFGASTAAAAAVLAAAWAPRLVGAVVSRGGRPDLAGAHLRDVRAPTLLIVGENDTSVLRFNRAALVELGAEAKQLAIVPGAGHLFEEAGTLEHAARLAEAWFTRYLHA